MSDDRLPWFKCLPTKLLGALAAMDPDEGLVYVAILLRIYEVGGPIADTPKVLARRVNLTERRAKAAIESLVELGKVQRLTDGRLDSDTTHKTLVDRDKKILAAKNAGILSAQTREEKLIQKSEQNQQNDPTDVGETLQQTANETPTIEDRRKKKEERKNGLASPAPFCASDPPEAEPAINLQPLNGEIIAPPVPPPNLAIVPKPDSFEPIEACLRRLCCEGRSNPHPLILAHDFRPIFELESRPEITRNDIENGIRQAIQRGEKPNNGKPLDQWKSCVGWIETAARDRLASGFVRDGPRSAAQDQANREAEFFMSGRSTF